MSQGEQTPNRPRFAKVDSWGWCDVGRDHDLAFSEVMLLLAITIHADFRSESGPGRLPSFTRRPAWPARRSANTSSG